MDYLQVQKILKRTILVGFICSLIVLGCFIPIFLDSVMRANEVEQYATITYIFYGVSCILFYYAVYNLFLFTKNFTEKTIFNRINITYLNHIHYTTLLFIGVYIILYIYMTLQNLMHHSIFLIYAIIFAGAAVVVSILKVLRAMIQEGIDLSEVIDYTV